MLATVVVFDQKIWLLGGQFFSILLAKEPTDIYGHPYAMMLSTTMSWSDLTMFGVITHYGFPKSVRLWDDINHFELDCCVIIFHRGSMEGDYKKNLDYVAEYLRLDDSSALF